jgi:hypothetical protein
MVVAVLVGFGCGARMPSVNAVGDGTNECAQEQTRQTNTASEYGMAGALQIRHVMFARLSDPREQSCHFADFLCRWIRLDECRETLRGVQHRAKLDRTEKRRTLSQMRPNRD